MQIMAFGRQPNSWREISSLVYDGLTVVTTKPPSVAPKNAMAYSVKIIYITINIYSNTVMNIVSISKELFYDFE